jgi:hypothetical protein
MHHFNRSVHITQSSKDIKAEATPPLLYAKASVSVPVTREEASLWNGISFAIAVSKINSQIILNSRA